jgi:NADPH:quinone reductase
MTEIPTTAPAVRIARFGSPEVIELVDVPVRRPGAGEVLVRLHAVGVNPVDAKVRAGKRHSGPLAELIGLGNDAAGVVAAVGDGVSALRAGDAVIGRGLGGAYATFATAPADRFTAKPDGVSFEQAAALGVPVGTAYQVLASLGLEPGQTLLVHAGAGAVGQAAIQLGRQRGARVIATASQANHERLRALGAEPVAYGPGLLARLRELAPDGVDRVLDGAGTQEALETSLALVSSPAHIGEIVNVEWADAHGVSAYSGSRPGYLDDEQKALRAEAIGYAAGLIAAGRFTVEIAEVLPLADAAEAHRRVETGHVVGKLVLRP